MILKEYSNFCIIVLIFTRDPSELPQFEEIVVSYFCRWVRINMKAQKGPLD